MHGTNKNPEPSNVVYIYIYIYVYGDPCEAINFNVIYIYIHTHTHTAEPRFTNKFSDQNVSDGERCLGLRTRKLATEASWEYRRGSVSCWLTNLVSVYEHFGSRTATRNELSSWTEVPLYIQIYGPTFGNAESRLFLFASQCFNTESMQKVILWHNCV
jgi:hypothetical protein